MSVAVSTAASGANQAKLRISAAVAAAIQSHPVVHLQTAQVRARLGELQVQRGSFASRLSAELGTGRDRTPLSGLQRAQFPGIEESITDTTFYSAGVQRQLRTGQTLRTSLDVSRTSLSASGQSAALSGIPDFEDDTISRFRVELRQPLLKGAGQKATAAGEVGAQQDFDAAGQDLLHTGSTQALATASAYWRYAAALKIRLIAQVSVQRSEQLLERTETLIRADKQPAADRSQLQADLAGKRARLVIADQGVFAARRELARQIGLNASDPIGQLGDDLPFSDALALPPEIAPAAYTRYAYFNRRDLQAARKRVVAAQALRDAARINTKHRLDLIGSVGYTGLDSGSGLDRYLSAIGRNVGGANYAVGLQYEYELGNQSAQGEALALEAAYEAQRILELDLERNIAIDVDVALHELLAARAALVLEEHALKAEREALVSEQRRYRGGLVTLFTLTQFQDRLDVAANRRVEAQRRFATAIVSLRHVTGSLLRTNTPRLAPQPQDFFSLPSVAGATIRNIQGEPQP